jgi:hypothetical protein
MPSLQYLSEIAGSVDEIFNDAADDPKIAPKRKPTLDAVTMACVRVVEKRSVAGAAALVRDDLQEAYDMYTITFGDRPEVGPDESAEARDAWDEKLDELVEGQFQPYADILSNDWMAVHTIDTRLHEEGAVDKLAEAFGKEVYKQLCWQAGEGPTAGKLKSPMQILSSAGIMQSAIIGRFGDRIVQEQQDVADKVQDVLDGNAEPYGTVAQLDDVLNKIFHHVGIDAISDEDTLMAELELVCDSDDILAQGAGSRLGLTADEVVPLQMLSLDQGSEAPATVYAMLSARAALPPMPAPPPAPASTAPAPIPPSPGQGAKPATNSDAIPSEVFALLDEHGGVAGSKMAEDLGVSRATYNNYVKGKTQLKASPEQRETLRAQLVADVNGLRAALSLLDGGTVWQPVE